MIHDAVRGIGAGGRLGTSALVPFRRELARGIDARAAAQSPGQRTARVGQLQAEAEGRGGNVRKGIYVRDGGFARDGGIQLRSDHHVHAHCHLSVQGERRDDPHAQRVQPDDLHDGVAVDVLARVLVTLCHDAVDGAAYLAPGQLAPVAIRLQPGELAFLAQLADAKPRQGLLGAHLIERLHGYRLAHVEGVEALALAREESLLLALHLDFRVDPLRAPRRIAMRPARRRSAAMR